MTATLSLSTANTLLHSTADCALQSAPADSLILLQSAPADSLILYVDHDPEAQALPVRRSPHP